MNYKLYTTGSKLPAGLMEDNFFHSSELFAIFAATPRHKPYMVTAETDSGEVMAQLLAVVRYRSSWFPPYLYRHCRVMGEGVYAEGQQRQELFGNMIRLLTEKLGRWILYFEVSNLSAKMVGYKQFRENNFFPVRWMSIHNSLHSHTPEERISERMRQRIAMAYAKGVVTDEVKDDADFQAFMRLLRHHNWNKPKRFVPGEQFFLKMRGENGRLFLTRYKGRIVGCSMVVYSQRQAYLWYAAYRRKSFAWIHPDVLTIWHAIKDAHARGYEHIFFLDVGLPFKKNTFREFILRFGGKPTSTYRWFRCTVGWVNSLLSWFYRD